MLLWPTCSNNNSEIPTFPTVAEYSQFSSMKIHIPSTLHELVSSIAKNPIPLVAILIMHCQFRFLHELFVQRDGCTHEAHLEDRIGLSSRLWGCPSRGRLHRYTRECLARLGKRRKRCMFVSVAFAYPIKVD